MKKRKGTKTSKSALVNIAASVGLSFLILVPTALVFGALLLILKNPVGNLKIASLAAFLISAAISGFVNSRRMGERGAVSSVISSLVFIIAMLSVSLVLTRGRVSGALFMNYLCYMLTASLFAAFGGRRKARRRRH